MIHMMLLHANVAKLMVSVQCTTAGFQTACFSVASETLKAKDEKPDEAMTN